MIQERSAVEGSRRVPVPGATRIGPVDPNERIEATIVLKRKAAAPDPLTEPRLSREAFAAQHAAQPQDVDAIVTFAEEHGLTVTYTNAASRMVRVAGPADTIKNAFGTQLSYYDSPRGRYRGRVGAVTLPTDVVPLVEAVLGLDNRPIAKPHIRRNAQPHQAPQALFPSQVAKAYNFPTGVTGQGQTIGIIELGGGFRQSDLTTYFNSINTPKPKVSAFSVLGAVNHPGADPNSDGEVMLDIEVAGAVAHGARIVVYFAPNTDQGFHDAIAHAVHDTVHKPSVISISWGAPESAWTPQATTVMTSALTDAASMGVTVTVAAGDDGSTDGVSDGHDHVDFPASCPFSLACGGTRLEVAANGSISSEVVWNDLSTNHGATGGGFSATFNRPTYQNSANPNNKQRGVPDVAGNADPITGYKVLVDGSMEVIGGTSAVAPLWAGLIALVNQKIGTHVGFWNPMLYNHLNHDFNDIVSGNNGTFKADKGWDPTTGLGTPDAKKLAGAAVTT
jgi:kumamolisin